MVLGEADANFRRAVSTAFFSLGLRDLAVCIDNEQIRKALAISVDVLLCDVDLPGVDFCAMAQNIRQGRLGANPFVVMIAMARVTDVADIARVLESGVDDLIVKPASADAVVARVGAFAQRRNPFVVSPTYVGPTRRGMKRDDGSDEEAVEVPNTLRAKVAQRLAAADLNQLVEAGRATVTENRTQSGLRVIARLTRRLANQQVPEDSPYDIRHTFRTLALKADEVVDEHRKSPTTAHIAAIAERIALLARRGEIGSARATTIEIGLMLQLSDAALVAFVSSRDSSGATPEVVAIVDEYLARV